MRSGRLILELLRGGETFRYGSDPSQVASLRLPSTPAPHRVIVLIHGGSWRAHYGRAIMRGLAGDLVARGWAVWNIEYRRVGNGGGWPHTFADVAAAIDHLAELELPLDLGCVWAVGHSAGGHLALWAASRPQLPTGAPGFSAEGPRVPLAGVVAQAGVCDLQGAYARWRGGAVRALMGASPRDRPERYAAADPLALLPLGVPALLVHGTEDATVTVELSRSYARAAEAAGGAPVSLIEIPGTAGAHRAHVDPRGPAWAQVTRWLERAEPAAIPAGGLLVPSSR